MMKRVTTCTGALYLCISLVLTTSAQLMWRIGMQHSHILLFFSDNEISPLSEWVFSVDFLLVAGGVICYFVSMMAWLIALTRFDVSFAYPLLAISYVLIYIAAIYLPVLSEQPSVMKLSGISIIVLGVAVVATSDKRKTLLENAQSVN